MRRIGFIVAPLLIGSLPLPASAQDGAMTLVLRCKNENAQVEVYAPQSIVTGRTLANIDLTRPVSGFYALDLTQADKGKSLEPARISLAANKKSVVIEQLNRKLPSATVPVAGGKVSFDRRFAENMTCEPFNGE
jgi:hypothetical protein